MKKVKLLSSSGLILLSLGLASQNASATGFLPQDARAMAMGGAGVAVGNSRQAHYYNPSLLVNAPEDEDFNFEIDLALRLADSDGLIQGGKDFDTNDPITSLATSINAFSNNPNTATVNNILNSSRLLQTSIQDVTNKSFTLDGNLGAFVSVPNKSISWALYVNGWANIGIQGNLAPEDNQALSDFITAGENLKTSGTFLPADISNFNALNPVTNLKSGISIQGAGIIEYGLALAKKQTINNYELDIGITPKIQRVTTFGIEKTLQDLESGIDLADQEEPLTTNSFNIDIAVSKELDDNWTTGLIIKNLIPHSYDIKSVSQDVKISPAVRIGAAWRNNWISAGADLDLTKNEDIASLSKTQFLSLGAEFDVWILQLRGGYRHNFAGSGGGPSLGLGLYLIGLNIDAAVATNSLDTAKITEADNLNASVQVGFNW